MLVLYHYLLSAIGIFFAALQHSSALSHCNRAEKLFFYLAPVFWICWSGKYVFSVAYLTRHFYIHFYLILDGTEVTLLLYQSHITV